MEFGARRPDGRFWEGLLKKINAIALAAAVAVAAPASADVLIAPGDVQIDKENWTLDTPLTDQAGDADRGRAAFVGRKAGNCLACHQVTALMDDQQFHGEVGPMLDGVAEYYSEGELRARIVDAKVMNPDTIMPAFYRTEGLSRVADKFAGRTILTAQEVEDVVAYVMTFTEE